MSSTSPEPVFPPPSSFSDSRSSLQGAPAPLSPILGREADVAAIVQMLDADTTRLVTLMGPGGVGKTRLALEIAHRLAPDYAHGGCFVALASVREPDLIPAAVAQALGLQEAGDRPAAELVISTLRHRHLLLVLDNLEHLVEAGSAWLSDVFRACPRVTGLVTSRIALQTAGEHRYLVQPLPLPDAGTDADLDRIAASAAVELFVERARRLRPDFSLTTENAEVVHQICRTLDGLPLAIELAASRVNVLSPSALLARLTKRLSLLQSGPRDAPVRHQTMRNAIGWSYDLLSPDLQRVFRRLSVFTGGFTLDAADVIGGLGESPGAELDIVDTIGALIDHSLVRRQRGGPAANRFEMLEVIREFGLDQLEACGQATSARDVHAAWYLQLARDADPTLVGSGQVEWLNRLEPEHDNIRTAIAWLVERGRIEEALDLTGSIWFFRWIRGYYAEGRDQYEQLLAHPDGASRTLARAKALNGLGIIALHQGDVARSLEAHEEAASIFGEFGEREYVVLAMTCLGASLSYSGRLEESERITAESHALAREIGYTYGIQATCCNLGALALQRGADERARQLLRESVDRSRAMGEEWGLSLGLLNLAELDMQEGKLDDAERKAEEGIELIRALGDKRDYPQALALLAGIARMRGDLTTAQSHLEEAIAVARHIGDRYGLVGSLVALADVVLTFGDPKRALALTRDAIEAHLSMGNAVGAALCLDGIADVAIAAGDMERAAQFVGAVDGVLERSGMSRWETSPHQHQGRLDALVRAIGQDRYGKSWAAGHALDIDAAIAEGMAYEPLSLDRVGGGAAPVVRGRVAGLSPREIEVLTLMADGLTNREIADALYVSHRTATSHCSNILAKLGIGTRTGAVAFAIRSGLV